MEEFSYTKSVHKQTGVDVSNKFAMPSPSYLVQRLSTGEFSVRSVLNKLTLPEFEIHMEELEKKYTPYTESG